MHDKYQKQLYHIIEEYTFSGKVPKQIAAAFWETPRHLYVKRYKDHSKDNWAIVKSDNLHEHLPVLYQNRPVILAADEKGVHSTISQPSFVLQMIDLLRLERGNKVLEIGAASGWNAALMGHIVASKDGGHVYSVEIIPDLVQTAKQNIVENGVENVSIFGGDGGAGWLPNAPYDRIIFTAGGYDIPKSLYQQLKEGGLLLMVLKLKGGGDTLLLLRKENKALVSLYSQSCSFVPLTGKYEMNDFGSKPLEDLPAFKEIEQNIVLEKTFWWGRREIEERFFVWKTLSFRTYLSIVEPLFETYEFKEGGKALTCFGLWNKNEASLVLVKKDKIIAYNNTKAFDLLWKHINNWMISGMPDGPCFNVSIYPLGTTAELEEGCWKTIRKESEFIWSLNV